MSTAYPVFQFLQVRGTNPNPGRVELSDGTDAVTIQASSATTNHTLNLPDSPGVSGDFLVLLDSSNSRWATPQTIWIWDISSERAPGVSGGTLFMDTWTTVPVNTLNKPAGVGTDVQLAVAPAGANQILLQPGEYKYFSITPAVFTGRVTIRLQDVTNTTTLLEGASAFGDGRSSIYGQGELYMSGTITVASQIVVQLEARRIGGTSSDNNLGFPILFASEIPEVYTQIQFLRVL